MLTQNSRGRGKKEMLWWLLPQKQKTTLRETKNIRKKSLTQLPPEAKQTNKKKLKEKRGKSSNFVSRSVRRTKDGL